MGLPAEHAHHISSPPNPRPTRTPCSETLFGARRAESSCTGPVWNNAQNSPALAHSRLMEEDYSISGSLPSSASSSSHPHTHPHTHTHTLSRSTTSLRSPCAIFDTALYDPSSDSIHIMPHARGQSTSLESQFRDFKNKVNSALIPHETVYWDSKRPHSLNIPLTNRDSSQDTNSYAGHKERLPTRASSLRSGHISGKSFE